MEFKTDQLNTFDTFTMNCWKDRVYYVNQSFPAGHFAAEILNFAGEVEDPLLDRVFTLAHYVRQATVTEINKSHEFLAEVKPLLQETVSWICSCPPFCYQDNHFVWNEFAWAMDAERFAWVSDDSQEPQPVYFLTFTHEVIKILISIYNFCLLVRTFEQSYLRRLKQRTESAFAKAAHDFFDEDERVFNLLEQMPFGEIEEFFSYPRVISGFDYVQETQNEENWISVQKIVCKRLVDFYVFDLMNGMQHGHAPSWCLNCHRYFLTTNGHMPKYCDGIAPQDCRMTCRQYGAMMRQKEQNKQHPIYRTFNTRTNTIRKHHQRGKISDKLRKDALYMAEYYRDKALMDNDYAANGYQQDMEQEHIYEEARKRLK